jgi:histidyl-tRNA synthetase
LTDKKGHEFLIMLGSNELSSGEIQVKNLKSKEIHKIKIEDVDGLARLMKGSH